MNIPLTFIPLLFGVLIPIASYAACNNSTRCDEHNLLLIVGEQYTHRSPVVHYQDKGKSSPREVDVRKDFTEDRSVFFPFLKLEYQVNQISYWDLTYNRDHTDTGAITQERVNFFIFPIKLSIKAPVKIDMQSLKIFYNRAFFQAEGFKIGGSLGMQVVNIDGEAKIPIFGKETESVTVPLPALGLFASYVQTDRLTYRLKTNYFSLGSLSLNSISVGGAVAEIDFSLLYQYTPTWMIGAGYRYSYLTMKLDQEDFRVQGSHVTYGPTIFFGASF